MNTQTFLSLHCMYTPSIDVDEESDKNLDLWLCRICKNVCCQEAFVHMQYSKTCVKWPLSKRPQIVFQGQLMLNAGQKYCRMLQGEHSAIFSTFNKLPFVIKIFVLSIFEWLFYTGFAVCTTISCVGSFGSTQEYWYLLHRCYVYLYSLQPPV